MAATGKYDSKDFSAGGRCNKYMSQAIYYMVITLVLLAAITDLMIRKIPNLLTFTGALIGFAVNTSASGFSGFRASLEGCLLGMGLLFVFYLFGGIGAGDVKLLGSIGALLGPDGIFHVFIVTGLVGGIIAISLIIVKRGSSQVLVGFKNFFLNLKLLFLTRSLRVLNPGISNPKDKNLINIPYGVTVAIGTILSFLIKW